MNKRWVVWYEHWDYGDCSIEVSDMPIATRESAFSMAQYLEDEVGDAVNMVIGIEDPFGAFIDLAEYYAAKKSIFDQRHAQWQQDRRSALIRTHCAPQRHQHGGELANRCRVSVPGPDGREMVEEWTDEAYAKKRYARHVEQFGADRVKIEGGSDGR